MTRRIVFGLAFVLACSVAQAATVYLKNGSSISGRIISRTADSVKLDVSGVTLTYYNDEIDRVDDVEAKASSETEQPASPSTVSEAQPEQASSAVFESAVEVGPAVAAASAASVEPPPPFKPEVKVEPSPSSQPDPYAGMKKKDLILKFIDVFGTRKSMNVNFNQMMKSLPANQVDIFQRTFKVEEIIQELIPLYDKHFTEGDLKALIDFYSTSIGRKLVDTIPVIMNESVDVSAKYFEAHMQQMAAGLKAAGVVPAQPAKP